VLLQRARVANCKEHIVMKRALLVLAALGILVAAGCDWENLPDPGTAGYVSDESLARLRECESGGDYAAVSRSGAYRGAYQFSQGTWDAVAAEFAPWLVGVDPATALPHEQDNMAQALFAQSGRSPWPSCGKRL
jgi:hypothetical protein